MNFHCTIIKQPKHGKYTEFHNQIKIAIKVLLFLFLSSKINKEKRENRIYVDKTMYIEKMEELPDKALMFLRPRKFEKTLFTSVLENYYDKNKTNEFEFLFKSTYIGKHPTE